MKRSLMHETVEYVNIILYNQLTYILLRVKFTVLNCYSFDLLKNARYLKASYLPSNLASNLLNNLLFP